jgi:hypothetical protein
MAESQVKKYLLQQLAAINCLTAEHPKHSFSVLILVYCGIDQFSWLNTEKDKHGFIDFQVWVDKYIFPYHQLNCNAEELWAARNGIVHMGTAESTNTRKGVAKIGYTFGPGPHNKVTTEFKLVSVELLVQAFIEGTMLFIKDLEHNHEKQEQAKEKLKKVLVLQFN